MNTTIGLEYEGVITEDTGRGLRIRRWSSLPEEARASIRHDMLLDADQPDPVDAYDCLAEIRTPPLENPSASKLRDVFLDKVSMATRVFKNHSLRIFWQEMCIDDPVHDEISADLEHRRAHGGLKKETLTLGRNQRVVTYQSVGNRARGGGIHINVSPIDSLLVPGFALYMANVLSPHIDRNKFISNYRTNLLFRSRTNSPIPLPSGSVIAEYMSFGMFLDEHPDSSSLRGMTLNVWDRPMGWCKEVVDAARIWTSYKR